MPGEPGPRQIGDAPHASDHARDGAADTPYGGAFAQPVTAWQEPSIVGGSTYLSLS